MKSRVRYHEIGILVGVSALILVMSTGCGKGREAEKAMSAAKAIAETATPSGAQNDYMQAYLTDEKMSKFISSLQEEINPFEVMFKEGGQARGMADLQNRIEEFNGYARKYGFADYADYMAVWGRIMVGEMVIGSEEMTKGMIVSMEEMIKSAEESLKKPDLDPEMKKIYEEQIVSSRKSIEDMQKPEEASMNAADVALVAKYKAQLDEATKKFKNN